MINVSVKNNINFPKINFQSDLVKIANEVIIPSLAANIDQQQSITGGSLPSLEESTIKYKQKKNLSDKILIATGKLRRSFMQRKQGANKVVIYMNSDRAEIGKFLQVDGVGKKKKHFNFFGISKEMEVNSMKLMVNIIKDRINAKQR